MGDLGQSLPPDTGAKLANLELGAEQAVASLGEAEQEHKRARTVRYDFQVTAFFNHISHICCFLLNNPSIVQISVNGTLFAKFKHRIKPEEITHLRLYGDIEPIKLEYSSKKGMH